MNKVLAVLITSGGLVAAFCHSARAVPVTGGGPGGLGTTDGTSSLELWFKADASVFSDTSGTTAATNNDPVGRWNNLSGFVDSGNPYHAIGDVATREPTFLTNQTPNGGPVLDFVGGTKNTGSRLHVTELGTYAMSGNETAFFALDFDQACCRGILSGNDSPNRAWAGGSNSMFESTSFTYADNYRVDGVDTPTTGTGFHIVTGEDNPTAASNVELLFGSGHGGNNDYGGRLAEAIVFDEAMSTAQKVIIENYLSAKHAIVLDAGDFYAGDNAGTDYDLDVVGIGNDGTGSVANAGAAGFGMEATVGANPDDLNANEFVMAGHRVSSNSVIGQEFGPEFAGQRWERTWNVDTNGNTIAATLGFDFDDAGLSSEFDAGAEFVLLFAEDSSLEFSILSLTPTVDSGERLVTFAVPSSLMQNGFFTLGFNVSQIPEPSTGLLFAFGLIPAAMRRRRKQ